MLEKLTGKCTSMSVAVPAASLYTFHMYKQIGHLQRTGSSLGYGQGSPQWNLRAEMDKTLKVRAH